MEIDCPEADLWVRVIAQALSDATIGTGIHRTYGRPMRKVGRVSSAGHLTPLDVKQARSFISGSTGALQHITEAMGMDYETTRQQLLCVYRECLPKMPEEWRQDL